MKLLKKMSALLVAVVMMAVTVVPTLAEGVTSAPQDPTATITVNIANHLFVAYQIFKGDAIREDVTVDGTKTNTGVLSNIDWGDGIKSSDFVTKLMEAFPAWDLTANSTPTDVANKFSGLSVEDANKVAQIAFENKTTISIQLNQGENTVRQGYYLIVDTTQNLTNGDALNPAILAVNGNVSVKEKKDNVTVDKTVKNETDSDFAGSTDSSIGKKVTFKLHTQIIDEEALANYESYFLQFSDTASNALDPVVDDSTKEVIFNAYLSDDNVLVTEGENADENITSWFKASGVTGIGKDNRTFTFTDSNIKDGKAETPNYAAGKHIFITYKATLNNNAVIGSDGNPNKVVVNYSNNPNWNGAGQPPHGTTPEDKAIVFTFELDGTKVAKEGDKIKLDGAEFVVYRMNGTSKEYAVMDASNKITGWEILNDENLNSKIAADVKDREKYLLISKTIGDNKGQFGIQGLGDGDYYLQETKAPDGYNLIIEPIQFKISSTQSNKELTAVSIQIGNTTTPGVPDTGTVTTTVENTKGTTLPETGGMGTTLLYVAGGILLIGSAVLLVTKKRMGHEN